MCIGAFMAYLISMPTDLSNEFNGSAIYTNLFTTIGNCINKQ